MPETIVDPHAAVEIEQISKTLQIDIAHAGWIEYMRPYYVRWEHDYVQNVKESHEEDHPVETG